MHVSDCSSHHDGNCDCTGLDLAFDDGHSFVAAFVPVTGCFGFFIDYMGGECFIEPHVLPALTFVALASTANLPDAHDIIAVLRKPDSMDFDNAREAIIAKLKAKTLREGVTSGVCVQWRVPNPTNKVHHTTFRVGV